MELKEFEKLGFDSQQSMDKFFSNNIQNEEYFILRVDENSNLDLLKLAYKEKKMQEALIKDMKQKLENGETITIVDGKGDRAIDRKIGKIIYKSNRNKHKNKVRKNNKRTHRN